MPDYLILLCALSWSMALIVFIYESVIGFFLEEDIIEKIVPFERIVYKDRVIKVPKKTVVKHIVVYRDGKEPHIDLENQRRSLMQQQGLLGRGFEQQQAIHQGNLLGFGAGLPRRFL